MSGWMSEVIFRNAHGNYRSIKVPGRVRPPSGKEEVQFSSGSRLPRTYKVTASSVYLWSSGKKSWVRLGSVVGFTKH